jgi:hypothetical protein
MGVKLVSTSGGSVEVNPPATASNFTQTLVPVSNTLAPLVSGTAVASTSGTSIDFTSIPSWVKRITVMFSGVSTSGTSNPLFQIGSGSVQTSGYSAAGGNQSTTVATNNYTTGIGINSNSGSNVLHGLATFTNLSGNSWVCTIVGGFSGGASLFYSGGSVTLSGTLDRVRITTVNGTDTFDAGSINILYE